MSSRAICLSIMTSWLLFIGGIIAGYYTSTPIGNIPYINESHIDINSLWHILPGNTFTAGTIFLTSIFTLGLSGYAILFINALYVGEVIRTRIYEYDLAIIIFLLAPHGIFEISSFGLFLGLGAWWSLHAVKHWFFHISWPSKRTMKLSLYQLISAFILLIIGALVEVFFTPLLFIFI